MLAILSPAKTMDLNAPLSTKPIHFPEQTTQVRELYPDAIKGTEAHAALDLYSGMAFKSMDRASWTPEDWSYADTHLVVLSALYGCASPSDGILPYRLDFTGKTSLYKLWGDKVARSLADQIRISTGQGEAMALVDLASQEFSRMILPHWNELAPDIPLVRCLFFKRDKDGRLKTHSTTAKKGRGLVAGQLIRSRVASVEDLYELQAPGLHYDPEVSAEMVADMGLRELDHCLAFILEEGAKGSS